MAKDVTVTPPDPETVKRRGLEAVLTALEPLTSPQRRELLRAAAAYHAIHLEAETVR